MSKTCKTFQESCLYFTANSLSRLINTLAEEAFLKTGLSPSYGHLMLLLIEEPGLSQNELSKMINVKASTMTRFIDKLIVMGYVKREHEGRMTYIHPTESGIEMKEKINEALSSLFQKYCDLLGKDFAVKLTADIHKANQLLMK